MSTTIVCDASAIVAMLFDSGSDGAWATDALAGNTLVAPALLPFEATNAVRRHEAAGHIGSDQAAQAHADLLSLPIEMWPYDLLGTRVWELRGNLTAYDAGYVALAELLDAPLVTLDTRIVSAPGPQCAFLTP